MKEGISLKTHTAQNYTDAFFAKATELERELVSQKEYETLCAQQNNALQKLKNLVDDEGWLLLDEYVSSKNAENVFIMNYFCAKWHIT